MFSYRWFVCNSSNGLSVYAPPVMLAFVEHK